MISAAMHRDRASMINGYEQGEVRVILLYGARAARFRARAAVEQLAFERGRMGGSLSAGRDRRLLPQSVHMPVEWTGRRTTYDPSVGGRPGYSRVMRRFWAYFATCDRHQDSLKEAFARASSASEAGALRMWPQSSPTFDVAQAISTQT